MGYYYGARMKAVGGEESTRLSPVDPTNTAMPLAGSITDTSVRGGRWLLARRVTATVTSFLTVAVLARRLSPAEFGLAALASVVIQFTTLVAEAGVGSYVVYVTKAVEERIQAAHWLNFAVTLVQIGACMAMLPWVRYINSDPRLPSLLIALAAVFFVQQFAVVPDAILQRRLRHRAAAIRDMAFSAVTAVISITMAFAGAGVWALVLPTLFTRPLSVLSGMWLARWTPGWHLHLSLWGEVFRYTRHVMGTNVLMLLTNDTDTLLIGKLFGTAKLGIYNLAWQLSNLVNRNITAVVVHVSLPALGLVRDHRPRMQRAFLRMLGFLGIVCTPILVGMGILAGELIATVYGPRWTEAALILQIFIVFTLVRALTAPVSSVYNILGRPDIGFRFALAFAPVYLLAIILGSRWGIYGVAAGVTITRLIGAILIMRLAAKLIDLTLRDVLHAVKAPLLIGAAMGVAVAVVRGGLVAAGFAPLPRLLIGTMTGVLIYVTGILWVQPLGWDDVKRTIPVRPIAILRRRSPTGEDVSATGSSSRGSGV